MTHAKTVNRLYDGDTFDHRGHTFKIPRVFRVVAFGTCYRPGRLYKGRGTSHKGAYTAIERVGMGYAVWSTDTTAEPWREGYGSFVHTGGIRCMRDMIRAEMSRPGITQIAIKTNQDREFARVYRQVNGTIRVRVEVDTPDIQVSEN